MPGGVEAHLMGRWMESHEERRGDLFVYRKSEGFDFPPARGRRGMTLSGGHELIVTGPGADDRGVSASGRWSLNNNVLSLDAPGLTGAFTIESVDEQMLVLRKR